MKRIRAGIIGAGRISSYHAQGYLAHGAVKLEAVCDLHRELIADEGIECVSVTTWNNGHAPISIAATRGTRALYIRYESRKES